MEGASCVIENRIHKSILMPAPISVYSINDGIGDQRRERRWQHFPTLHEVKIAH